jgi:DNA-binding HxlR family transcriptional regulator
MDEAQQYRSKCPINLALEIFGDKWSLLIVRDIVYFGKNTFGEFLQSAESVSSHTLTRRLVHLEETGILQKKPDPEDKRKDLYALTDKGLDLIPILLELGIWGGKHSEYDDSLQRWIAQGIVTKEQLAQRLRKAVTNGRSLATIASELDDQTV